MIEKLYKLYLASSGVTTDTRNIGNGNIFFALKGESFNANLFAEEALEKGAAYVVVDELSKPEWKEKFGEQLILVDEVLKTLQQLAGHHRKQFKCPVLAITGSNGKTTTKELIASVLSKKYKTYATKGNLNNHIGIPLTLLSIKDDAQFAVIEMGANHIGEIASYCEYVQPDYGLITNVGMAHTEGFGGFDGVVKGKTELYAHLASAGGKIFVSSENNLLLEKITGYQLPVTDVVSYGKSASAFCKGEIVEGKEFLSVMAEGQTIQTNLIGDYNFENVMSAVCVGKYFGVNSTAIKEAIENYVPTNNRSQKIAFGSSTIILDAYNANPSSMIEALKNFEKMFVGDKTLTGFETLSALEGQATKNKRVVILGQMMELGKYAEAEHKKIAAAVSTDSWKPVTKVFVGSGFQFVVGVVGENTNNGTGGILWFEKTDEVKAWFKQQRFENSYILIKGSRKNELEKILKD